MGYLSDTIYGHLSIAFISFYLGIKNQTMSLDFNSHIPAPNFYTLLSQEGELLGKTLAIVAIKELSNSTGQKSAGDSDITVSILIAVVVGILVVLMGIKTFKNIDKLFEKKNDKKTINTDSKS